MSVGAAAGKTVKPKPQPSRGGPSGVANPQRNSNGNSSSGWGSKRSPSSGNSSSTTTRNSSTATTNQTRPEGSQTQDGFQASSELAAERTIPQTPEEKRAEERRTHLQALEDNYSVFDNPDGGKSDGISGLGDFERVAKGDFDREAAAQTLRDQGVAENKINERLDSVQDTANYFLNDKEFRESVDTANDENGNPDGKFGRADIDRSILRQQEEERNQKIREAEERAQQPPTEQERREAQNAIDRWHQPGALEQDLKERPLSEFSSSELDALAALNEGNPEAQKPIQDAVLRSVNSTESLNDLPQGDSYSHLLNQLVTGREVPEDQPNRDQDPTVQAQQHLDGLVKDQVKNSLDTHLEGRSGDADLNMALDRVSSDLQNLAVDNPALAQSIQSQSEATFGEYNDKFTEVGRKDDNFLQRVNHSVTGAVRDGVGFVSDKLRDGVDAATGFTSGIAKRVTGLANGGLDLAGRVGEAGLDLVGAEGVGDNFRNFSDQAGDHLENGANYAIDQSRKFTSGLTESVAGGLEGVAYAVTDPKGAVDGVVQAVKDPSLLIEGYRETAREHGVAGATGQVVGDVALAVFTGGAGAAVKGTSVAGKLGSLSGALARTAPANVLKNGAARGLSLVPGGIRNSASRATRGLNDLRKGDDSVTAARRSQQILDANPQLQRNLDDVRTELEAYDNLSGPAQEAKLQEFLDPNGKFAEYASQFDEVAGGGLPPGGVGDIVAKGRSGILDHIRENFGNGIDARKARELLSGALGDTGDLASPAYLTRLGKGSEVFRAFDSASGPGTGKSGLNGGYVARKGDSRLSPEDQRRVSALPNEDITNAQSGAYITLENDTYAVVTRAGQQLDSPKLDGNGNPLFGDHASGGGWQVQLLDNNNLYGRLGQWDPSQALPDGVRLVTPGTSLLSYQTAAAVIKGSKVAGQASPAVPLLLGSEEERR